MTLVVEAVVLMMKMMTFNPEPAGSKQLPGKNK